MAEIFQLDILPNWINRGKIQQSLSKEPPMAFSSLKDAKEGVSRLHALLLKESPVKPRHSKYDYLPTEWVIRVEDPKTKKSLIEEFATKYVIYRITRLWLYDDLALFRNALALRYEKLDG
jgi:hypothetical protein